MAVSNQKNKKVKLPIIALDLDGVIYNGSQPCLYAAETVACLRNAGYQIFFITNNSGQTRAQIANKLDGLFIPTSPKNILTSGTATGLFLKHHFKQKVHCKAIVIGTNGLMDEIADVYPLVEFVSSGPCDVLVVGFTKEINYQTIKLGLDALLSGAFFLACNTDSHFPGENGQRLPGCGAIVGAIAGTVGREPDAIAGKPESIMLKWICAQVGCTMKEILVVGDTLESDILMAKQAGSKSIFISSHQGTINHHSKHKPTAVIKNIGDLPDWLKHHNW